MFMNTQAVTVMTFLTYRNTFRLKAQIKFTHFITKLITKILNYYFLVLPFKPAFSSRKFLFYIFQYCRLRVYFSSSPSAVRPKKIIVVSGNMGAKIGSVGRSFLF